MNFHKRKLPQFLWQHDKKVGMSKGVFWVKKTQTKKCSQNNIPISIENYIHLRYYVRRELWARGVFYHKGREKP